MCLNAKEPRRHPSIGRRAVKGCRRMGTGQVMKVRMPESCEFKGDIRPSRRIIVRDLVKGCRGRSHPGRQTNDGRHITRPRPVPEDGMRRALVKGCRAGSPADRGRTGCFESNGTIVCRVPPRRGKESSAQRGFRTSRPDVGPIRWEMVKGCRTRPFPGEGGSITCGDTWAGVDGVPCSECC